MVLITCETVVHILWISLQKEVIHKVFHKSCGIVHTLWNVDASHLCVVVQEVFEGHDDERLARRVATSV